MNVEDEWTRLKELVRIESPSKQQGEEMRDLIFRLSRTHQGRGRIETGLNEPLDGKARAIKKIVTVLDERRDEIGLSRDDRIRLLEHLSNASASIKEKVPYWTILWLRLESGDPRIGKVVIEAMDRLHKGKKRSVSAVQSLIQHDPWKNTSERSRSDLLEAALKAESRPEIRRQIQEAFQSYGPRPRPPVVQLGPKPTGALPVTPHQDGGGSDRSPPLEKSSGSITEVQPQMGSWANELQGAPEPVSSEATETDPNSTGGERTGPLSHDTPHEFEQPGAVKNEEPPSGDQSPRTTVESMPQTEPAQDETLPEVTETRKKPRARPRTGGDEPGSTLELSDPARRVADILVEFLPRLDARVSDLTGEVRGLARRLPSPDERSGELASLRDELRRVQDSLRERQKSLDEAGQERDRLKSAAEDASAKIRAAEEKARAAEARADQHIHLANRDRDNSIQNYLASLRPDLRRLLVDIGDHPHDDEAIPQTETEVLLWQRLREIKQTLRNHGLLLD